MLHEHVGVVFFALPLIAQLVDVVCARLGIQKKELACALGYSQPYLSRVLAGERPLNVETLTRFDAPTLRAFGEALIQIAGGEPPLTLSALREELDARIPAPIIPFRMLRATGARKEGAA